MTDPALPVLIAGGGTVGLAAALFLAHHGIPVLVAERHDEPDAQPRAVSLGPRTMEILREVGLEDAVNAAAVERPAGGLGRVSAPTLASADLPGAARAAAARPEPAPLWSEQVFPSRARGTCPQSRLDAMLLDAAREHGAAVRYGIRLASFAPDDDGITATVDGPGGPEVLRTPYLVVADGASSRVRAGLGIGTSGPGGVGAPVASILFRADLSPYTGGYSFTACDITGTAPPATLVTVDGRDWILRAAADPADGLDAGQARALIRAAAGVPDLEVEVLSVRPWQARGLLAERFAAGRVFLAGDAAHAVPPPGDFGLDAGLADAHNLAWKLAAVLSGQAGPALLDTYEAERRPAADMTLAQALLRLGQPMLHRDQGPDGAAARAAAGALSAPVVHLGFRYDSAAVIDPGPALPSAEDVALDLDGSPGTRLPHAWLVSDGQLRSTLDLVQSRWTVLAGLGGEPWIAAAQAAAEQLGVPVGAYRITPGTAGEPRETVSDASGRWAEQAGLGGDGALLVRPDQFVAWRSPARPADPAAALTAALTRSLSRSGEKGGGA
jgi:putative polyketide hydroxylase